MTSVLGLPACPGGLGNRIPLEAHEHQRGMSYQRGADAILTSARDAFVGRHFRESGQAGGSMPNRL